MLGEISERKNNRKKTRIKKPRIVLTERDLKHLVDIHGTDSVAVLAKQTGLPYLMVYNILNRRVMSVSDRHYRILFQRKPPAQAPLKVDGTAFREMAKLWLYLNEGLTQADLYEELFEGISISGVDHRIFSGKINTIDARLEQAMRSKFSNEGVDAGLLEEWLTDFEAIAHDNWVPYARIRPVLIYLEKVLGVHPTSVLNQSVVRYETGELQRVARSIADQAQDLKQKTEKALRKHRRPSLEIIRETILGGKPGYRLYSEIKEELLFLCKFAKKGVKHYLGRSLWTYENGKAKRIPEWRALKILRACDEFIQQTPTLTVSDLPRSQQYFQTRSLVEILRVRTSQLLSETDEIDFEKRVLRPSRAMDEYNDSHHGFTPFDMAPSGLGMRRKAFDLMVANHCDIFRSVGKYTKRWYLPALYLRDIAGRKEFDVISAKYERLANNPHLSRQHNTCLN